MLKFVNRFTLSVMLLLTLCSQKVTAADLNLSPSGYSCLDRQHKEAVEVCFQENDVCHQALMKDDEPEPPSWEQYSLAGLAGIIAGAFLDGYLRK